MARPSPSGERLDLQIPRRLINVKQNRASNYAGLITHFEAHTYDAAGPAVARYAAVAAAIFDDQRIGAKIALFDVEEDAFECLGGSVLEGYDADGVYDLDSGDTIDVHVSTPIVTRAEEQGVTANPLAE
jgi:hypothetical protein